MKVLLSAYSCDPGGGSEPGIGWNWARAVAAEGHTVTVVTRSVNRPKIDSYLERTKCEGLDFIFCDLSNAWQRLYKLPLGNYLYYLLWQKHAARKCLEAHRNEKFDLVHHITWGSFRVPSFMGALGIPFIFGPVAGGEDTPVKLRFGLGWRGRAWDWVRRLSNRLMSLWMRPTYSAASMIVATTEETRNKIPVRFQSKTFVCQAVGVDPSAFDPSEARQSKDATSKRTARLEALFVGRLLAWKGLHLLIRALAETNTRPEDIRLSIVGSGNDIKRLRRLSRRLKVEDQIAWISWMDRGQLLRTYVDFDLFAFTSLHDSGGAAVLEAMTYGLPVLSLDCGGPGVLVTEDCGRIIKTADLTEGQVVASIASNLKALLGDPLLVSELSKGAERRVASLTWKANVKSVYYGADCVVPAVLHTVRQGPNSQKASAANGQLGSGEDTGRCFPGRPQDAISVQTQ